MSDTTLDLLFPPARAAYARVYALLDPARGRFVREQLRAPGAQSLSLFRGVGDPRLRAVAPHLLRLDRDRAASLLAFGWGQGWGVFVRSVADMQDLAVHLGGLLRVTDERGRRLYFRFYDPRVLRVYLPTCTEDEIARIYGSAVEQFVLESATGAALVFERCRTGA